MVLSCENMKIKFKIHENLTQITATEHADRTYICDVCPSVYKQKLGSNWTDCMKFDISLRKYEKKIQILLRSHKNKRYFT